jgi:hypothetical protein
VLIKKCADKKCAAKEKSAAHLAGAAEESAEEEASAKERGPLTLRERPKSREETPKEGDGIERGLSRYRTATTYTASHKTQVLLTYFNCIFPHNLLHFVQSRSTGHQSGFPATLRFKVNAHKISQLTEPIRAIVRVRKIEAWRL